MAEWGWKKQKIGNRIGKVATYIKEERMVVVRIKDYVEGAKTLSSRQIGRKIRNIVEKFLEDNDTVVIDFNGIELISQSFGDEILGVLIRERGINNVKGRVKIANAAPVIKSVMSFVISYSKERASKRKTPPPPVLPFGCICQKIPEMNG